MSLRFLLDEDHLDLADVPLKTLYDVKDLGHVGSQELFGGGSFVVNAFKGDEKDRGAAVLIDESLLPGEQSFVDLGGQEGP